MRIDAKELDFRQLGDELRKVSSGEVTIDNCLGQRFIASGMENLLLTINGVPGNALGSYLNGTKIFVNGNAQDATGDTMNDGEIIIDGSVGDALGYAMRGGRIFVRGNSGYRTGIHMKQYKEKIPVIVVGGSAGSFLGEYMAGGIIVVLGLNGGDLVGNYTGTGMHGGKIFLREKNAPQNLPSQVAVTKADESDMQEISSIISEYAKAFDLNEVEILDSTFWVLRPNTKNPYKRLYTQN